MPCAFLFSEYLDRVAKTVSDMSLRKSVMVLAERMISDETPVGQQSSFFDLVAQSMAQHFSLSPEQQAAIQQKVSPLEHVFAACAQLLKPDDLIMVASIINKMKTEGDMMSQEEAINYLTTMRQAMDGLASKMGESQQMILLWLVILMMLPGMMVNLMQQSRKNSLAMAQLFNKVLAHVLPS